MLARVATLVLVLTGTVIGPVADAAAAPVVPGPTALPYGYRATPLVTTTGQLFAPSTSGNPIVATDDRIAGVVLTPVGPEFDKTAAVFYVRSRTVRLLRPPGSIWANAVDINRHGQVTGTANFVGAPEQVYVWTPSTNTYKMIRSLGGHFARPTALNDSGVVVGSSMTEDFRDHAFVSDPTVNGGRMQDLGMLPGDGSSGATGINNAGDVVGYSDGPSSVVDRHAFLWRQTTKVMTDIGHVAGDNATWPTDINDKGYIVGGTGYYTPDGGVEQDRPNRGFVFSPATHRFRVLPSPRSDQAVVATAINVHGVIVGTSTSTSTQNDQALLWNACGKPVTVLLEGQYGTAAFGINRYEHVVGSDFQTGTFWRRNDGRCQLT